MFVALRNVHLRRLTICCMKEIGFEPDFKPSTVDKTIEWILKTVLVPQNPRKMALLTRKLRIVMSAISFN